MSSINKKSMRANDPHSAYRMQGDGNVSRREGINDDVYNINSAADSMSHPTVNSYSSRFNRRNMSITRWYQGGSAIKGKHSVNKV